MVMLAQVCCKQPGRLPQVSCGAESRSSSPNGHNRHEAAEVRLGRAYPLCPSKAISVAVVALTELHDFRIGNSSDLLIAGARCVVDAAADADLLAGRADDSPAFI